MDPTIELWFDIERNHAKYSKNLWGRSVIRAIDMDESIALYNTMQEPEANIDTQIDVLGYAQYLWTTIVHKYLGDTALHLAIRQRKMMCVHMLLRLNARFDIANAAGETADQLCVKMFGTTAKNLQYEAVKFLLHRTPLKDISKLPDDPRYRHIDKEAWKLMEQGRVLYTELPKSLGGADPILDKHLCLIRKNYLSFNLPKKAASPSTPTQPAPDTSAAEPASNTSGTDGAQTLSVSNGGWVAALDNDGNQYYYNEETGESSWDKPAGFRSPQPSPSRAATPGKQSDRSGGSNKSSPSKAAAQTKGSKKPALSISASSASSSASNSRSTSPTPLSSPHKGQSAFPSPGRQAAATKSGAKAASMKGRGAKIDEDGSSHSESEDSLAVMRRSQKAKAKADMGEDPDSDSSDSFKGGLAKKGRSGKGTGGKGKPKGSKLKIIQEAPKKAATPPKPRTLREQYQDAGVPLSQRAEVEVLREDCRLLAAQLVEMTQQKKTRPGVSVPPLPEGFAERMVALEEELRDLQQELETKSRAYYSGTASGARPSPSRRQGRRATESPEGRATTAAASTKTKTGVPFVPAAVAAGTGDVWGRDNLCDVIYVIERQKTAYFERLAVSRQPVAKGLKLLESVKISNAADRVVAHEQHVAVGKHDPMYIPEDLEHLQGVKKLKFMNMTRLRAMATQGGASLSLVAQHAAAASSGTVVSPPPTAATAEKARRNMASRLARAVSDKILYQQEVIAQEGLESISLSGSHSRATAYTLRRHQLPAEPEYALTRDITVLSTRSNMKYMKVGDEGAESLGRALQNDHTVTELCLAGARITSLGMSAFAQYLPDIKALRHLDLCNNAICDRGASALAAALPYCVLLEQCNLAGNRITGVGAVKLVQAVFKAPLTWLSLKNNLVVGDDEQAVLKLLEEHNYGSEQQNRIYEHRAQSTVGVQLAPVEEGTEDERMHSSLQEAPRALKMFIL